jgi:alpha-methylacyl-CoA racemase
VPSPLAGTRVVEIACIGPGPFAEMLLADLGAEIVRIDRPDCGGATRSDGESSVAIDLKHLRGADLVLDLVADADVLVEGMRQGVMERPGPGARAQSPPRLRLPG